MKFLYSAALLLPSLAVAGEICVSTTTQTLQDGGNKTLWDVFDARDLCLQNAQSVDTEGEEFCDSLPMKFILCGRLATLVKAKDAGVVDEAGGCGMVVDIRGDIYPGRRVHGLRKDQGNPCSAECGEPYPSVTHGKVVFEDLPMCNT